LISSVTDSKDAIIQYRVAKHKARADQDDEEGVKVKKVRSGEQNSGERKRIEKEKALVSSDLQCIMSSRDLIWRYRSQRRPL